MSDIQPLKYHHLCHALIYETLAPSQTEAIFHRFKALRLKNLKSSSSFTSHRFLDPLWFLLFSDCSALSSTMNFFRRGFYCGMDHTKLQKMAGAVRTGGKGSVRRKKKAVHKTTTTDDKRLQSTLKRIGVNAIPAIEEVNIFKDDVVIQFTNPKVQASIAANTWVVSGSPQTKKLQDILPGIINQLGPDNLDNLRKLAEQFQKQAPGGGAGAAATANAEDDDDDVPDLVEGQTFEAAAEENQAS
ncbi:unnamed protein product [Citrullus colocynthis]|uniref:Nascent polypeptide-associated complex subunit beta n=1 Tax=Citrullus colocynthis TaxID=252529 RepID=A0ABP0XV93_9ROSI